MVTVLLLGKLADLGGRDALSMAGPLNWAGLRAALPEALAEALADPRNRVAVNGVLLADKGTLQASNGDEIALLPPVSGG